MTYLSAPKRAISIMLAIVLAVTMIPSEVIPQAYAEPASDAVQTSDSAEASEAAAQDEASEAPDATTNDSASDDATGAATSERPTNVVSATERITEDAAKPTVDMTRASVALTKEEVATVFAQGPLSFQVNADAPETVSLVGIASDTEITSVTIPDQVTQSGKNYTVTRIIPGGGQR